MTRCVGLIAGLGELPLVLAKEIQARAVPLVVIRSVPGAFEVQDKADSSTEIHDVFLGQWGRVVKTLTDAGVDRVYLAGKIPRDLLYQNLEFDSRFAQVLSKLDAKNDDAITEGFLADLEREGIQVGEQREFLSHLTRPQGPLTKTVPTPNQWRDIARGYEVAKAIAGLDVGQTVVVKDGAVLAVEAADGTDATILRGGAVGRGGAVVVKTAKPHQDPRFDVPTIGLQTLDAVAESQGAVLAFDADKTFILDPEQMIAKADELGISIVSYAPDQPEAGKLA